MMRSHQTVSSVHRHLGVLGKVCGGVISRFSCCWCLGVQTFACSPSYLPGILYMLSFCMSVRPVFSVEVALQVSPELLQCRR